MVFKKKIICQQCNKFYKCNDETCSCVECEKSVNEGWLMEFLSRKLDVEDRTNSKIRQMIVDEVDKILIKRPYNLIVKFNQKNHTMWFIEGKLDYGHSMSKLLKQ